MLWCVPSAARCLIVSGSMATAVLATHSISANGGPRGAARNSSVATPKALRLARPRARNAMTQQSESPGDGGSAAAAQRSNDSHASNGIGGHPSDAISNLIGHLASTKAKVRDLATRIAAARKAARSRKLMAAVARRRRETHVDR